MALLPRLRHLMRRPTSASRVGVRRPSTAGRHGDTLHEDALRSVLSDDPNNERAFSALAEVVRRRAGEAYEADHDPLRAPGAAQESERAAELAVWSLAEELSASPRAWFPLLELARLSIDDDHEAATRRLATAAERDTTGRALAVGIGLLRERGRPGEALNLGVGHWRVREQLPEVGEQLVLAALDAERPADARQHLDALTEHPDGEALLELLPRLQAAIAATSSPQP